jgi:hypothetical protein
MGMLTPLTPVQGPMLTALEHASIALSPYVTDVPPMSASISCASDGPVAGYTAIGPAVRFGPENSRLLHEYTLTLPVNAAMVASLYHQHIEVAWRGPGPADRPARIVPLANVRLAIDGRTLSLSAMRLGTFQPMIRSNLGTQLVRRTLNYHAVMGISMGGVGTSLIATRNANKFDTMAPLGGPADAGFSGYALRSWVSGGFCTAAQRAMLGDALCASASMSRVPPANDLSVDVQDFEHFYAPPGMGTGGTFDRAARLEGFRDITRMFGNPFTYADPQNGILPLGVPPAELARTDAERCRTPVVLGGAMDPNGLYYDDEYNPDGRAQVITFCDGNHAPNQPGLWSGGQGTVPVEVALAVDLNGNRVRDAGEPVIRNVGEPFRDVGLDGLASVDEPGFHPLSNPDPSNDDYDRQFNPSGTEQNFLYDVGEPYSDLGIDGVRCPVARCAYDVGEGNGRYDNVDGMPVSDRQNPRRSFIALSPQDRDRMNVWIDGGVRDALQFGVNSNHFASALAQSARGPAIFNAFNSLLYGREVDRRSDAMYSPDVIDWPHVPQTVLLRYGFYDATMSQILEGDGAHVGTTTQIADRLTAAFLWIASRWPDLDKTFVPFTSNTDNAGRCANGYVCTFDFRSDRANRTGPVSVALPPGYHRPENRDRRYPVVFALHGYGMQPQQLLGLSVIIGQRMVDRNLADWQRPGKFIMVFPDGSCRAGDNCLQGSFFADSPNANGARFEQFFLDLYDYIDRTYRVATPTEVQLER